MGAHNQDPFPGGASLFIGNNIGQTPVSQNIEGMLVTVFVSEKGLKTVVNVIPARIVIGALPVRFLHFSCGSRMCSQGIEMGGIACCVDLPDQTVNQWMSSPDWAAPAKNLDQCPCREGKQADYQPMDYACSHCLFYQK